MQSHSEAIQRLHARVAAAVSRSDRLAEEVASRHEEQISRLVATAAGMQALAEPLERGVAAALREAEALGERVTEVEAGVSRQAQVVAREKGGGRARSRWS